MRGTENFNEERKLRWQRRMERQHRRGHVWTGALLLLIGVVALMKSYVTDFPKWLFSWQMLLITLGLFIGFRHRFKGMAWFILLLVGGVFMANEYFLDNELRLHIWPVILIAIGISFIFRAWQKPSDQRWFEKKNAGLQTDQVFSTIGEESYSQDDFLDTTSIFGGTKKIILSKNFKGGDIVNIFGGTELNLTQADINGTVELEITTVFGGTKLILPSHWSVKSEAVTIFGGIDDKRQIPATSDHPNKILLLKGTVIFGGIDIRSF